MPVRERLRVAYFECTNCKSLQTEKPYWLQEAYSDSRRPFDVFAATRSQRWQQKLFCFRRLVGIPSDAPWLDWGAGDGLLVRLLRDVGINAYHYEPHGSNVYAVGFEADLAVKYAVITATEVWEHMADPAIEIDKIFALSPDFHIATTLIYTGQDETWQYLYAQTGRHVFFYSTRAVEFVARKYGYKSFVVANHTLVFHRPEIAPWRLKIIKRLLANRSPRLFNMWFGLTKKPSLMLSDHKLLLERFEQNDLPFEGRRASAGDPQLAASILAAEERDDID
jgi:hypothetical protein